MDNTQEELGRQLKEITMILNDPNFIASSSNEELMGYLFMVDKIKFKLQEMVNLEDNK